MSPTEKRNAGPKLRRARGFTLIEVLVTVIVLAIGLLGLAGLQLTGLRYNYSAYQRSQATILTNDIVDRMRANRTVAETGGYNIALGTTPTATSCEGTGASCTPATMATADLYDWKETLADVLPAGDGSVTQAGLNFTITIQWDDTRGEEPPQQLAVETVL